MVFMPEWPKFIKGSQSEKKIDLSKMHNALSRLGNPHKNIPPAIHIAGTNGKGSSLTFIKKILQCAGYSVHAYTSPHLINFNERIVISDNTISDSMLSTITNDVRSKVQDMQLSFFEGTTLIAFYAFAKFKAHICLIEVGLGGVLDPTNVIENKIASLITSISKDHTEILGDDINQIVSNKAGIMTEGVPCIVGKQEEQSTMQEITRHIMHSKAKAFRFGHEWSFNYNRQENHFIFTDSRNNLNIDKPSMEGIHQIDNAANALATICILNKKGFNICLEDINEGIKKAVWPARLSNIKKESIKKLLPNNLWELYVDGAHNCDAAKKICKWLKEKQHKKKVLIIGFTANKDIKNFLLAFKGNVDDIYTVCVRSEPQAYTSRDISNFASEISMKTTESDSIYDALEIINSKYQGEDSGLILLTGSLYLFSDVRKIEQGSY